MNQDKKEHLKIIEDIIQRMATNSFKLKQWAVSLISAILAFSQSKHQFYFIWVIIIPIIIFWYLDAFYLQLERKYRKLYQEVQQDYLNNTNNINCFDLDVKIFKTQCIIEIMFTKSLCPIYLGILIAASTVYLINCTK